MRIYGRRVLSSFGGRGKIPYLCRPFLRAEEKKCRTFEKGRQERKKKKSEAHFCRIELLRTTHIHVGWACARTPEGNLVQHPPVPTPSLPLSSLPYSRHICCHTWTYPSVPVNNNLLPGREGRRVSEGGPPLQNLTVPLPPPSLRHFLST